MVDLKALQIIFETDEISSVDDAFSISGGDLIMLDDLTSEQRKIYNAQVVQRVKSEALTLVKSHHAETINNLSGNATTEERDTWPLQKEWAKEFINSSDIRSENLLLGLMTSTEKEALGDVASQTMAEKIIAKSHAMDLLTSTAGGLKREADEALSNANSTNQIQEILGSLEGKMKIAIQEYLQAVSNG